MKTPAAVWGAFVLVHLWLGLLNLYAPGLPMGDVTIVYKFWTEQALNTGFWVGIHSIWVYPIVAWLPMLGSAVLGPDLYGSTWLTMVMIVDAVAFGVLTGWGRARERIGVAWWWIGFLFLLGPISLGRIDSISVPLAMIAVLVIARRPKVAAVILTLATWIKVWPAALLLAAVIALRDRWRILIAAVVTSGAVVVVSLAFGSGANVVSFITQQTGRGLQPEAPVSTFFMWQALAGVPGAKVYYDEAILSYGVKGPGDAFAIAIMSPLLAIVVLVIAALGLRAVRAGARPGYLFPALALAFTTTMIAINKVGSPQYIAWLAVPIVLGIATSAAGQGRSFRTPATVGLALAALTQFLYPYFYSALLMLKPLMVVALTVRNILEFVLLGWAIVMVYRAPNAEDEPIENESWLPAVWPFARVAAEVPSDTPKAD